MALLLSDGYGSSYMTDMLSEYWPLIIRKVRGILDIFQFPMYISRYTLDIISQEFESVMASI